MTDKNDWEFVHSVASEAEWKPGLRKIFDYRDLGIRDGTGGDFIAHVIRRNDTKGTDGVQSWHVHDCQFQMVYVLNGWATFEYDGLVWPLPQTGQMWLEYELLTRPSSKGFFCVSTSYRQEPNAIPGRHDTIFPMFEFEMPGDVNDLKAMEYELCEYLGFDPLTEKTYAEWQAHYGVSQMVEMDAQHELAMDANFGSCLITDFPEITSPFWNMARNNDGNTAKKMDVILGGMETIGSAERSCDVDMMRDTFHSITDGAYSKLLFELFGKDRVEAELEKFLEFDFFQRVGGGIGITRMIPALEKINKI